ncbi:MAG TPA: long-chain fatty acid--CoA ligase [Herpetosiphonaceae bacterium]
MDKPWLRHYEASVPHALEYPATPLPALLDEAARNHPTNIATNFVLKYVAGGRVAMGGKLTYRQLKEAADRFATALHALGVRKGDRIAVMLPNSPQFVIAFFGALRLGAVVVNINPTYTPRELRHQLDDSGAETIILLNLFAPRLREIQAETRLKRVIVTHVYDTLAFPASMLVRRAQQKEPDWVEVEPDATTFLFGDLMADYPPAPPPAAIEPDDVALFQYTGGTTGAPKAAMLTHHNLIANTIQIGHWMPGLEQARERVMCAIPFFHVYGMTVGMCFAVSKAAEMIILPNPRPVDVVMEALHHEKATVFPGVPALYIGIINHKDVDKYDLKSIKACISGSAALPMEVQERFGEITGGRLVEGYGLTEAAPVTHCNPIYGTRKSGSIGVPFPDVEIRVVDLESGEDLPVGSEREGELLLKGPQVMKGYWGRDDETAKTITEDGWLKTGDIVRTDEDGYCYIVDRKKDLIIASGYNIVPREVEEVLFMHPKVLEATVAGIPDTYRGETVKAYVVLKPGEEATAKEIRDFCKENLAPYKVPTAVEFLAELPKTQVGKVLRRVLVEEEKRRQAEAAASGGTAEPQPRS